MTNLVMINIIQKYIDKMMEIDFSNVNEVKTLKEKLIQGVHQDFENHRINHDANGDYCDCNEYDERIKFCRKLLRITNETIENLE